MYRNVLVAQTGLKRGVVLNGSAQNITDGNEGAGNTQVGTFYLDFSGLFKKLGGDDDGLGGITNLDKNLLMVDNEFSVVLVDARGLGDGPNIGDDVLDEDELDPETDDYAFIGPGDMEAEVASVNVDLRFTRPRYRDAFVYLTDRDTGEIAVPYLPDTPTLEEFLDQFDENATFDDLIELADSFQSWQANRSRLRFTLHWALIVVDCSSPVDQGLADFQDENVALQTPSNPSPDGGPFGLLAAYGGNTRNAMRLWTPGDEHGSYRFVARGEREYTYEMNQEFSQGNPDTPVDPDVNLDMNLDPGDVDSQGYAYKNVDDTGGKNIHLKIRLKRAVKLRPGQMLVFVAQTGRARLVRGGQNEFGQDLGDLIIAGTSLLSGRNGPTLRLYHYSARVTGHVR